MKNIISLKVSVKQKIDTLYEGVDRLLERIYQFDLIKVIRSHIDQFVNTFNQISNRMIYLLLTTYSVIFTFVSFNLINFQSRSYDYVFHLTRIVGLAESIEHWDLLPNLNFLFAFGTGYASPMFYICIFDHSWYKPSKLYCCFKNIKKQDNWVGSGFNNTVLLHLIWFWNDHGNATGPNSYLFSLSCALPK